jgi:hypothetical protein
MLRRTSATVLLGAFAVACVVTDTGNPPAVPEIDPTTVDATFLAAGVATIFAGPGAIEPPVGVVRMTNLDGGQEPVDAPVQADGSFSEALLVEVGDVIRFQVVVDTRSRPIDLSSADWTELAPPLAECFTLSHTFVDLVTARSGELEVRNECAEPVTVAVSSRITEGNAVVATLDGDSTLAPGASFQVVLAVADLEEPIEEIVFITATAAESDRRAVTVIARP